MKISEIIKECVDVLSTAWDIELSDWETIDKICNNIDYNKLND